MADIQVTVGDKTFDCLRKLYPLDQNVLAGFAGNVETGFAMLERLHQLIVSTKQAPGDPADIEAVFRLFPRAARELFADLDDRGREGGSALLIAAGEPADNTIYGSAARVACFQGPAFAAQEIPHQQWGSIGSGSDIPAYLAELEKLTSDEARELVKMEVGMIGGHASIMASTIIREIGEMPRVPGISMHFHVGTVVTGGWRLTKSDRDYFPGDAPPVQIRMPPVAESWQELQDLLALDLRGGLGVAIA